MLEKIALRLTSYMIEQGVVAHEDAEIYVYGWKMLLFSVGSFSSILLVGFFLGQLWGTALFLLFFTFLRSYAGGYHANTFSQCFLTTITIYTCCLLLHSYLPELYWDLAVSVFLLMSIFITYRWAPIDHPNKPFRGQQKQILKELSRIVVLSQTLILLVLRVWQPWLQQYLLWAALAMAVASLTLLYVIYHPYKK